MSILESSEMRIAYNVHKLAHMKRTRSPFTWLVSVLLSFGIVGLSIYVAGTLAHRYPTHFSVFGVLFPLFAFGLFWTASSRKRMRYSTPDMTFGISEAGVRIVLSPDKSTLIPWDQILSIWHSKALGIMIVRSPLLDGRHVISRRSQKGREDGAFEKAQAFMKKSVASGRWHECWF